MAASVIALLYRRVSTDEQARDGLSLDAQQQQTRWYAARRGWSIGGEFADVLTGTRADRPQYQALLAEATRQRALGRHAAVVVARLDRFGRSVLERARSAEQLRMLGIAIHSVDEGGLLPQLVADLLAAVAEEEVHRLGERLATTRARPGTSARRTRVPGGVSRLRRSPPGCSGCRPRHAATERWRTSTCAHC